jgi:hypothetical protein
MGVKLVASSGGSVELVPTNTASNFTVTVPAKTGTMAMDGPAFSAYKNSGNQSVTSNTFTKVTFDTEFFDTNSNFASSTFTPTVAGYYQINAGISSSGTASQTRVILMLYKNGSVLYALQDLTITSYRYSGSSVVYMNGSTDYLDVYVFLVGTSPLVESGLSGTGYNSWFNGALVRAA